MPSHADAKLLPYTPQQLYSLVADVARYPEFLPWCLGARIREQQEGRMVADLIIGQSFFRETFTSIVTLTPYSEICVTYGGGSLKSLNNQWKFTPKGDGMTELSFFVEFSFASLLAEKAMSGIFTPAVARMTAAFESRAHALFQTTKAQPEG